MVDIVRDYPECDVAGYRVVDQENLLWYIACVDLPCRGGLLCDLCLINCYLAGLWNQQAEHDIGNGALASSGGSDQSCRGVFVDGQGEPLHRVRLCSGVTERYVPQADRVHAGDRLFSYFPDLRCQRIRFGKSKVAGNYVEGLTIELQRSQCLCYLLKRR